MYVTLHQMEQIARQTDRKSKREKDRHIIYVSLHQTEQITRQTDRKSKREKDRHIMYVSLHRTKQIMSRILFFSDKPSFASCSLA